MKLVDWISYDHLDIPPRNRFDSFWNKCISSKAIINKINQ